MLIVLVDVLVLPECREDFIVITRENASESRKEPGVARFDVLTDEADPNRFQLVEIYRTDDAPAAHKQTAHYNKWREAAEPMMARPRTSQRFRNVSPDDAGF